VFNMNCYEFVKARLSQQVVVSIDLNLLQGAK
jgi:hypothetical protein